MRDPGLATISCSDRFICVSALTVDSQMSRCWERYSDCGRLQPSQITHLKDDITWCPSRGLVEALHQRFPRLRCCLEPEFGEPAWLRKVLFCSCRLSEQ